MLRGEGRRCKKDEVLMPGCKSDKLSSGKPDDPRYNPYNLEHAH